MRVALNSYLRTRMEIAGVARQAPQLLAGGDLTTTFSRGVDTQELQVTKVAPDPDARYYYSLLAMSAGMGMMLAVLAVKRTQPGISALGVRRAMAGTPRLAPPVLRRVRSRESAACFRSSRDSMDRRHRVWPTPSSWRPPLSHANPLWHMANCFYALLYYDTLGPFFESCLVLLAMATVFFAVAVLRMRRLSYAHL